MEEVPAADEHERNTLRAMRVVVADPPAFTPPYDHALAAALARAGADVELVTSRFRFGDVPSADGYRRRELFYPLSSRLFRRSRLRLPLKVLEHPLGLARLAEGSCGRRAPAVGRRARARRAAAAAQRPARLHGARPAAAAHGVEAGALAPPLRPLRARRRPQRARPRRPGRIRRRRRQAPRDPPPGLPRLDRAARRRLDRARARPRPPVQAARPGARGGLARGRSAACASPATRARSCPRPRSSGRSPSRRWPSSPTARSSTRAARSCARSARASPRSSTTWAGWPSRCASSAPAASSQPDDVDGLAGAIRELLHDSDALEEARAGALRAREELTWDAAAAAHLDLYRELR